MMSAKVLLVLSSILLSSPMCQAQEWYLDTFNRYHAIMNVNSVQYSTTLEGNDWKTLNDSPGQMIHELNPGTYAQVLAQGDCGDFEGALKCGWICEVPGLLPAGSCDGCNYDYQGQTDHAEIVSSNGYSQLGCSCFDGIWGCDLA